MLRHTIHFLFLISIFTSCELFNQDKSEEALARVYDKFLYRDDISDLLAKLNGEKDSATIINNYINNWIQQELLLQKAELNLTQDQKDFKKLLEDYRKSLIIYAYHKEFIRQKLDTNVGEREISAYYDENQANFELKENIVRANYVKVPKNAPKLNKLEKIIQSEKTEDKEEFRDYCLQYALLYNDNDSVWQPFDDLLKKLNMSVSNHGDFLRRNKFVVSADSSNYYMIVIKDFRMKNGISPLSFEHQKIRSIIINQRKLDLLSRLKENLFNNALEKGNAEIINQP